ncbi:metalloprotease TldD [Candidatus Symbiobacter mobilis]|nr:metalloprotease TldD [Candidatus Symbiobacter mobilis]
MSSLAAQFLDSASAQLLAPAGLDEPQLFRALELIRAHRVQEAELYLQCSRSQSWGLEEGIVKTGAFSIEQGLGVRAVSGEKTAYAYSDDISAPSLFDAAHAVRSIATVAQSRRARVGARKTPRLRKPSLYADIDPTSSPDSATRVALLHDIDRMARAKDPRVVLVMASVAAQHDTVLIVRADGRMVADVRPLVRLHVKVIAEQNGRRETGSSGGGGRTGLSVFDAEWVERCVDDAVSEALTNLEARPAPAGEMTVVLGAGWPGILLHEAVGHGLEADFNRKGSSAFSGLVGQRVAAPGVTVVDDGTLPLRRGSLNIDDEGNATQSTVLIEDGILRGYLHDAMNARLMRLRTTGNGRRESYACAPIPRMTNTFLRAGTLPPEEVLASVRQGLYATHFSGGQVDITSGKFVFSTSRAYWVENGKVQYPVKGATLIGSGPECLQRVTMIASDMQFDTGVGTCGKEGQSVPVGVGQPTLRIEGLTVGGTA